MTSKCILFVFCSLLLTGVSAQELQKIETFKAPKYPKSKYVEMETYDYRIQNKAPIPATLTDTFICDVWQRTYIELELDIPVEEVTPEVIQNAIAVYMEKDFKKLAGYRPWTHLNFIRSLTEEQRETLALEVYNYIIENGVRDVKEE
jgi:hypothetical protein